MNPICQKDINSLECQMWMSKVCTHCRSLFSREACDTWAAWWHDKTPAVYKGVEEMTVYDCNKLKHLLEIEVAALLPETTTVQPSSAQFKWWQKLLLILFYIGFIVICVLIYCCCKMILRRRTGEAEKELEAPPEPVYIPPVENIPLVQEEKKKVKCKQAVKGWMRNRCRPIFVHNEGALRRQQAKYREKEQLREAHTRENIEKWTRAREKLEHKRMEKSKKASEIPENRSSLNDKRKSVKTGNKQDIM